jgi:hypothetical protein
MILDWIYNNQTWLWGTIIVVLVTSAACIGLLDGNRCATSAHRSPPYSHGRRVKW